MYTSTCTALSIPKNSNPQTVETIKREVQHYCDVCYQAMDDDFKIKNCQLSCRAHLEASKNLASSSLLSYRKCELRSDFPAACLT